MSVRNSLLPFLWLLFAALFAGACGQDITSATNSAPSQHAAGGDAPAPAADPAPAPAPPVSGGVLRCVSFSSDASKNLRLNVGNRNNVGRIVTFMWSNESCADLSGLPLSFTLSFWRTDKTGAPDFKQSYRVGSDPGGVRRIGGNDFMIELDFGQGIYFWSVQMESPGGHHGTIADYADPKFGNTFTIDGEFADVDDAPDVPQTCKKRVYIGRGRFKWTEVPCTIAAPSTAPTV